MAWDDVFQSFVQQAGSAFKTYEAAQAPPLTVPPGATIGTTASGQTYIQNNNTMWLIIGLAVLVIVVLLFLRR